MEVNQHLRMRTAVTVASMIILPLAAVVGVKWPHFVAVGKQTSRSGTTARIEQKAVEKTTEKPSTPNPKSAAVDPTRRKFDPNITPATAVESTNFAEPTKIVPLPSPTGTSSSGTISPGANIDIRATTIPPTTNFAGAIPTTEGDPYTEIQNRLRALGATYYALETWGADGRAFRFQCRLAAGHNPNYHRHFEATDGEPLRAMRTVLEDVEAWKAGRLP